MPSRVHSIMKFPSLLKGTIVSIIYHSDVFHFNHAYIKIINSPSWVNLITKIPLFSKEGLGEICLIQKELSSSMTSIVDKSSPPPATRHDQSNKYISSECESAVDF